jgi:uncharacterized protein YacL
LNLLKALSGLIHEFNLQGEVQQSYIDRLVLAIQLIIITKMSKKPMKAIVEASEEVVGACMDHLLPDMWGLVIKDFVSDLVALIETAHCNGVTPLKVVKLGLAAVPRMIE